MSDRYPHLGRRQRCASLDEVVTAVRRAHPSARMEDSAGPERAFWTEVTIATCAGIYEGPCLVANAWPVEGGGAAYYVRIDSPDWQREEVHK
jgi:hypothetical protein